MKGSCGWMNKICDAIDCDRSAAISLTARDVCLYHYNRVLDGSPQTIANELGAMNPDDPEDISVFLSGELQTSLDLDDYYRLYPELDPMALDPMDEPYV